MKRFILPLLLALAVPAQADVLLLKKGQRIEGKVVEKGADYQVVTDLATLLIPKVDVERRVKSPEAIQEEAESLKEKARALFKQALPIEGDAKARNGLLREAIDLLKKAADLFSEAAETYPDSKHGNFSENLVLTFQEIRIYRDRMVSELAEGVKPPPAEEAPPPILPPAADPLKPDPASKSPEASKKKKAVDPAALEALANQGDMDALFSLGDYYRCEKKTSEAIRCFTRAAARNHARSMDALGRLYLWGVGIREDYPVARDWFMKAASLRVPISFYHLGQISYFGHGRPKSLKDTNDWCEKGAKGLGKESEEGVAEWQFALGWMYQQGMGVPKDPEKAIALYRQAAENDFTPGQIRLAFAYQEGKLIPKDGAKAVEWFERSEALGNDQAGVFLAQSYIDGSCGITDPAKGAEILRKHTENDYPNAMYTLGWLYLKGKGVPNDPATGFKWIEKAAKLGHLTAINDVGYCYGTGQGVPKDLEEAAKWYALGAPRGNMYCRKNLGAHLIQKAQYREGMKWLLLAAGQGLPQAQDYLGDVFSEGKAVPKNPREAIRWYLMASQLGLEDAKKKLERLKAEIR